MRLIKRNPKNRKLYIRITHTLVMDGFVLKNNLIIREEVLLQWQKCTITETQMQNF